MPESGRFFLGRSGADSPLTSLVRNRPVAPCAWQNGRVSTEDQPARTGRLRMTGKERREQLIGVGRALFAENGFEGATIEEIASRAGVSKPVVYEHFGGKEGLYAVVVDRELDSLVKSVMGALSTPDMGSKGLIELATFALLDYIETSTDGFRILARDSPPGQPTGSLGSLISDATSQVEHLLGAKFKTAGINSEIAPIYAQMLVGMVVLTGQWWLNSPHMGKTEVAAHLVNLAWNGLRGMDPEPRISERTVKRRAAQSGEEASA